MYSLTFRVRVATPPQYGRNGTAHAAGASILSPARGVFAGMRSVRVRAIVWACGRGQTDRQTHTHTQTDTQTRVTTIHFSWSTTHAKCNYGIERVQACTR